MGRPLTKRVLLRILTQSPMSRSLGVLTVEKEKAVVRVAGRTDDGSSLLTRSGKSGGVAMLRLSSRVLLVRWTAA